LKDAVTLLEPLGHPQLGIVADLFHMALEEPDIPGAIRRHGPHIGHVHLADSNRRLPGQGSTNFPEVLRALQEIGYEGWMAYECGEPGRNLGRAQSYLQELPASLKVIGTKGR
jgi:sugar phosphate isomerase/epimerase